MIGAAALSFCPPQCLAAYGLNVSVVNARSLVSSSNVSLSQPSPLNV